MTRRTTIIVTAFAAVVTLAWAGAYAQNALQAKPTAVGVVDMEKVLNQLKEKAKLEAELRALGEKFQAEEKSQRAKINDIQAAMDLLPADKQASKQEELQRAVLTLQVNLQFNQQKIATERSLQIEKLYKKANETIAAIAKQSKYDLVLQKEGEIKTKGANLQQIMAQLANRKVLYASETIDITDQVINQMNNQFNAGN